MGPLTHGFFSVTVLEEFLEICNCLEKLAYFIVRLQDIIHITHKIWVTWLFMLPVMLQVNSRFLVKFWGTQKLYLDFSVNEALIPLTPALFKGQLYLILLDFNFWQPECIKLTPCCWRVSCIVFGNIYLKLFNWPLNIQRQIVMGKLLIVLYSFFSLWWKVWYFYCVISLK